MESFRPSLSDLSFALIGFDDGDLMALSGMLDQITSIQRSVADDALVGPLALVLRSSLDEVLSGQVDTLPVARLSQGVDLLERWLSSQEQGQSVPASLVAAIQDWIAPPAAASPAAVDVVMSEPLAIFLSEAHERLGESQGLILDLEADPENKTFIDMLFRTFHTIKGECGFLKIGSLGELAHHIENLLDLLRSKELVNDDEVIELLFQGIDMAQELLSSLDRKGGPPAAVPDLSNYLARLKTKTSSGKKLLGDLLQDSGRLSQAEVATILAKQKDSAFTKRFGQIATEEALVSPQEINDLLQKQKASGMSVLSGEPHDPLIKVKASQVNYLVDMIGELLIIENQLDDRDKHIVSLKKISRSIQNAAMQLRTVKVKSLFVNLKRISRDAAKQLGKTVTVETLGDDLEIDRNLVERLEEPMMHMVRNCVGHGIESAQDRLARGKPEAGSILISALRQGNNIVIGVRDDGAGLDETRILNKAISKGLVPEVRRQSITRSEVLNLIFLPGFSTSDEVNAISGRGVGMDIVKTTVAAARGRVETKSELGIYTEFSLVFPLSLAIIDGMIVTSRGVHYIIPIANIVETMKIERTQLQTVEGRSQVIDLRHEILPVVSLAEFFSNGADKEPGTFAIIVDLEEKKYALLVDSIVAKKEVVIKSLGKKFRNLQAISSAAVLPGGSIGFVVNIEDVVRA